MFRLRTFSQPLLRARGARVVIAWFVAAAVALPLAATLDTRLEPQGAVGGSESARLQELLRTTFDSPWREVAIAVVSGLPVRADTDSGRALLRRVTTHLESRAFVGGTMSPATMLDTMLVGSNGTTAVVLVGLHRGGAGVLDTLRAAGQAARAAIAADAPLLDIRWTGQGAFVEDLRRFGMHETRRAELRALPFTIVVVVWAFGSLVLAACAVGIAALALVVSLAVVALLATVLPVTSFVTIVAGIVALALSLDYVLYLTWRRRAIAGADATGQRTVFLAGALVALAFAGLVLAPTGELRGAASGGAVVAIVAAFTAVTLTPLLRRPQSRATPSDRWISWGRLVTRRPIIALLLGVAPLVLLASRAPSARLETPFEAWLPQDLESVAALAQLEAGDRGALVGTSRVLLQLPPQTAVLTSDGWDAVQRATRRMASLPSAASARSIGTIGTGELTVAQHVLPGAVKQALISRDGSSALIDVLPDLQDGRHASAMLVSELRALDAEQVTGLAGARLIVGGLPAYARDYAEAARLALPWIIVVVSVLTWVALAVALRAPLAATKAVLLNLLVATAAIGATVLVFQDGWRPDWSGAPVGSILPTVPLLAFGAAFGVSIDYELFLLAAVRERWLAGDGAAEAAARGVAAVGGLITRAAAVMMCLFFALASSELQPLAMIGFTLGAAVLLDATLVRLVVAPAMLRIAGDWNWWPGVSRRENGLEPRE